MTVGAVACARGDTMSPECGPLTDSRIGTCGSTGVAGTSASVWEFPKIGDPNIVPPIVGSLL